MQYSSVDGLRTKPQPGLQGLCPSCSKPTISKCGDLKVWHWSHKGRRTCDPWWENETAWHREWKNKFPDSFQEVIQFDEITGEKHIADIKTKDDWIIEFQHSFLKPEERNARNLFYKKIAWVVDGTRRKLDQKQFESTLKFGKQILPKPLIISVSDIECKLLKEWADCPGPVLFDFGTKFPLWMLSNHKLKNRRFLYPLPREVFVHSNTTASDQNFSQVFGAFSEMIRNIISEFTRLDKTNQTASIHKIDTFHRHLQKSNRNRKRF